MKTLEELQLELNKQTLSVESVILMLDKASMLLGHWANEYVFSKNPDPDEALKCRTSKSGERSRNEEQSFKWFYEYSKIIGFMDIVSDYVFESRKLLEKAVYGEKSA